MVIHRASFSESAFYENQSSENTLMDFTDETALKSSRLGPLEVQLQTPAKPPEL